MTKIISIAILLLVALSETGTVRATTVVSPLQIVSSNLSDALESYARDHDNQLPTSWGELGDYIDVFLVEKALGTSLDNRFVLMPDAEVQMASGELSGSQTGRVVAITRSQINEDRRQESGRYVIWVDGEGQIQSNWSGESVIGPSFAAAGIALPQGEYLPEEKLLEVSPNYQLRKYAEAHFADPDNPTAEEIERAKQDFIRMRDRSSATASQAAQPITTQPSSSQQPMPVAPALDESAQSPSPLLWVIGIVSVLAVGILGLIGYRFWSR